MSESLDDLFLQATSYNRDAYKKLYEWFVNQGLIIALNTAKTYHILDLSIEDAKLQLSELFVSIVRTFIIGSVSFEMYSLYLIRKRISTIMNKTSSYNNVNITSLDDMDCDGNRLIDLIESDDYYTMHDTLSKKENNQIIASTKIRNNKMDWKIRRVISLKEQGFSRSEIIKIMSLTDGQYRYLLRLIYNFEHGKDKIDLR